VLTAVGYHNKRPIFPDYIDADIAVCALSCTTKSTFGYETGAGAAHVQHHRPSTATRSPSAEPLCLQRASSTSLQFWRSRSCSWQMTIASCTSCFLQALANACMVRDPKKRPTFPEVVVAVDAKFAEVQKAANFGQAASPFASWTPPLRQPSSA